MSSIVDPNGRVAETEKAVDEESKKNGKSDSELVDIRTVPTGTLIYNLVLAIQDERGAAFAIHQMEMMKEQQKMLIDPPPMVMAKEHYANHEKRRFALANEINIRFEAVDRTRLETLKLEVVVAEGQGALLEG